jgi:hypothetical protein
MHGRVLLARTGAIIVGLVILTSDALSHAADVPTLTLPDGSVISIAAITYGTNHVVGSTLARLVASLPASLETGVRRVAGQRAAPRFQQTTVKEELAVWVERIKPATNKSKGGSIRAFLADSNGFISGKDVWYSDSATAHALNFSVFPRRSEQLSLHLFYSGSTGGVFHCGSLPFTNPEYRKYPEWQPEPLPAVKRAGDVEVTLSSVVTGHDSQTIHTALPGGGKRVTRGTDRKDGRTFTACEVKLRSLADTNHIWQVTGEELSDATGNAISNTTMSWDGAEANFAFSPSLWPGEKAWRLKLELKRRKGFSEEEQLHFTGVPLGAIGGTNVLSISTNHSSIHVTLAEVIRRAALTNDSWSSSELSQVKFLHSPLPAGMHMDLINAVTDGGVTLEAGSWSSSNNERSYQFRNIPADAKTADFTFVIQRSIVAEFTVKPELAEPASVDN